MGGGVGGVGEDLISLKFMDNARKDGQNDIDIFLKLGDIIIYLHIFDKSSKVIFPRYRVSRVTFQPQ